MSEYRQCECPYHDDADGFISRATAPNEGRIKTVRYGFRAEAPISLRPSRTTPLHYCTSLLWRFLDAQSVHVFNAQRRKVFVVAAARIACLRDLTVFETECYVQMVHVLIRMDHDFV
jgi:hypothetical protein